MIASQLSSSCWCAQCAPPALSRSRSAVGGKIGQIAYFSVSTKSWIAAQYGCWNHWSEGRSRSALAVVGKVGQIAYFSVITQSWMVAEYGCWNHCSETRLASALAIP